MSDEKALNLVQDFRSKVDEYLFVGYSPAQHHINYPSDTTSEFLEALENQKYKNLRREINENKNTIHEIVSDCGVGSTIVTYPPPAIGGPVFEVRIVDLITNNTTYKTLDKSFFLDMLDATIGELKRRTKNKKRESKTKIEKSNYTNHSANSGLNYWNYVNPLWLVWHTILFSYRLLRPIWQKGWLPRIISFIVLIITLLAIDYTLALGNLNKIGAWMKSVITLVFH